MIVEISNWQTVKGTQLPIFLKATIAGNTFGKKCNRKQDADTHNPAALNLLSKGAKKILRK